VVNAVRYTVGSSEKSREWGVHHVLYCSPVKLFRFNAVGGAVERRTPLSSTAGHHHNRSGEYRRRFRVVGGRLVVRHRFRDQSARNRVGRWRVVVVGRMFFNHVLRVVAGSNAVRSTLPTVRQWKHPRPPAVVNQWNRPQRVQSREGRRSVGGRNGVESKAIL